MYSKTIGRLLLASLIHALSKHCDEVYKRWSNSYIYSAKLQQQSSQGALYCKVKHYNNREKTCYNYNYRIYIKLV